MVVRGGGSVDPLRCVFQQLPSSTLSDPRFGSTNRQRSLLRTLYFLLDFGNLQRTDRFHCDGARAATGSMARAVQELLRPSRTVVVPADVRAGRVQRQRAEVDASHAGAGDRAGGVPSVSAFHHACALGCRSRLATAARRGSGTSWRADSRQHELSETGTALGRRGAAVLRGARQDRQLPSRGDGGAVDGDARVVSRRRAVSAGGMADPGAAQPRRGFLRPSASNRSGVRHCGWCDSSGPRALRSRPSSRMPNSAM
jgi:hypothetical protein